MWNVGTTSHTTSVKVNYGTIQNWVGLSEIRGGRIQGRVQMWNPLGSFVLILLQAAVKNIAFRNHRKKAWKIVSHNFTSRW